MAPRALGALLAIVAAIAFVVSVASSSWWSGHPDVAGRTITAKTVRVGLLGATGCNTGGDGTCESVEVTSGMQTAGLIELVAIGVTTMLLFMLAVSAWRVGDRRKTLGSLVIVTALLTGIGAVGVLLMGPAIHASQAVSVPIGWGTFVLGGGLVAALMSSAITRNLEVEPFRLKSSSMVALPIAPSVREILREQHDGLRPTQLGPEPMMGSGPAHMIPARASAPLIGGAPQLRPLYDPANDGYIPAPVSPPLPMSPPTPLPQSMIDQLTGNKTPLPDVRPPARQHSPSAPPPARSHVPSAPPPARSHAPSAPPPARSHAPSAPPPPARAPLPSTPPPPARAALPSTPPPPARAALPSTPPPLRGIRPSVPPPVGQPRPPGVPMSARSASPSVPMPSRGQPPARAHTHQGHGTDPELRAATRPSGAKLAGLTAPSSTLAHAVPPMPENTPAPSREGRAATEADDRLDKAMRPTDYITAVEIDADAKAAAAASQLGDVTETNLRIEAQRVPNTGEDSVIAAPPTRDGTGPEHGEVLSSIQRPITLELAAQNVLTDGDPGSAKQRALAAPGLAGLTTVQSMPPSRITNELGAQTIPSASDPFAGDSAVQPGGVTQEMSAQRMTVEMQAAEPLTDQLARQQHAGSDTEEQGPHGTDRTRQPDDSVPLTGPSGTDVTRRPADRASQAPISTHAPRGADHTPIPTHARPSMSTAPTNLSPPKPSEAVASGPTPGCPQCESPMAWVEEHLRFYCKQCRMYF